MKDENEHMSTSNVRNNVRNGNKTTGNKGKRSLQNFNS